MRNVSGSTAAEKRLIKAVQGAVGAVQDGSIGTQTLTDLARVVGADCWPLGLDIYGCPTIIAKDLTPAAVKAPLANYANAISGSFSYNQEPCSILVSNGECYRSEGCHAHLGKPESVLYRCNDGTLGIKRMMSAGQLPLDVTWAIGGLGLLGNYDPAAEGFTGKYSDVLLKNTHTMVGCKAGFVYLVYIGSMTGEQVNAHAKRLGLDYAVMLDGGHVSAINSESSRINTAQKQYYIVQAL